MNSSMLTRKIEKQGALTAKGGDNNVIADTFATESPKTATPTGKDTNPKTSYTEKDLNVLGDTGKRIAAERGMDAAMRYQRAEDVAKLGSESTVQATGIITGIVATKQARRERAESFNRAKQEREDMLAYNAKRNALVDRAIDNEAYAIETRKKNDKFTIRLTAFQDALRKAESNKARLAEAAAKIGDSMAADDRVKKIMIGVLSGGQGGGNNVFASEEEQ